MRVSGPDGDPSFSEAAVKRAVTAVLDGEGVGRAAISVTFLSAPRMRGLNRRSFGRDMPTDVIAFPLPHPDQLVGDIYVCPAAAHLGEEGSGTSEGEEMVRLVVHGVLHVLGHDHPEGEERTTSPMWSLQERYVTRVSGSAR